MSFTIRGFPRTERSFELSAPARHLVEVPLVTPTLGEMRAIAGAMLDDSAPATAGGAGAGDLWRARSDAQLRTLLQYMDLVIPRGPLLNLVTRPPATEHLEPGLGDQFADLLLTVAAERRERVYFLGGRDSEPFDWARRAAMRHPGIIIAGAHAPGPDFRDAEGCRRLVERLGRAGPGILFLLPSDDRAEHFALCYRAELPVHVVLVLWGGPNASWTAPSRRLVGNTATRSLVTEDGTAPWLLPSPVLALR